MAPCTHPNKVACQACLDALQGQVNELTKQLRDTKEKLLTATVNQDFLQEVVKNKLEEEPAASEDERKSA